MIERIVNYKRGTIRDHLIIKYRSINRVGIAYRYTYVMLIIADIEI